MKPQLLFVLLLSLQATAQEKIDAVINAEKDFAALSRMTSTRKAFLTYVDSNCIGFNARKGIFTNVFTDWLERKEDSSLLSWQPAWAFITADGDMGATTGPWQFRFSRTDDSIRASGSFASVWKKKNGNWKNIMDIGTDCSCKDFIATDIIKNSWPEQKKISTAEDELLLPELQFINDWSVHKKSAFSKVISTKSWFNINGYLPLRNKEEIESLLDKIPADIIFTPAGLVSSANKDMIAVYGLAERDGKKKVYMRVWARTGKEWKLMLMTLHW